MENIYQVIYSALEFAFPIEILEHAFFGFILQTTVFTLALGVVIITAYIPILIAFRLALRGVKKWF